MVELVQESQLIVVDDESDVIRHDHGASVEGTLDTLEQLHQSTHCQHSRLSHGLPHVLVQTEQSTH